MTAAELLAICEAVDGDDPGSLDEFHEAATVATVAALCRYVLELEDSVVASDAFQLMPLTRRILAARPEEEQPTWP